MNVNYLDSILTETDLSNIAFTIIKMFSTQRPIFSVLTEILNTIGCSLKVWTKADTVAHVFLNPQFMGGQCHRLVCSDQKDIENKYEQLIAKIEIAKFGPDYGGDFWRSKLIKLPIEKGDTNFDLIKIALPDDILNLNNREVWISQFDFTNWLPLGEYCVTWFKPPELYDSQYHQIQTVLFNLARCLSVMLSNHFPVHENTYFPSYCKEQQYHSAILFADIRNSTSLFEIARLGGEEHIKRVENLLKIWLEYASALISSSAIGLIHRFTGDGIMATFGEYAITTETFFADRFACILALHSAKHLVDSFNKLYSYWRQHEKVKKFYLNYNEDVDLNLGIGINYGNVSFGYFGISCPSISYPENKDTHLYSGHLEYTAIGDNINTAERLEGIASKLEQEIDLCYRCEKFKNRPRICPIVMSQTVANRLIKILDDDEQEILKRRGCVMLKGKGTALPFYEIDIKEINLESVAKKEFEQYAKGYYYKCITNPPALEIYIKKLDENL